MPAFAPDFLLSRLLYRDGLMLIIDKPPGIPVHAGRGGGENLELYFDALRFGMHEKPSLAHRLDKETSGCLVLGRHRKATRMLGELFAAQKVEKTYWAIVHGIPAQEQGRVDLPLKKLSDEPREWRMCVGEGGQAAVTDYKILGQSEDMAWLELKPRTGRTHQLRVHLSAIGHPIVGDWIYGTPYTDPRLRLHARGVSVPLYKNKPPVMVEAEPPEHMLPLLAACGYKKTGAGGSRFESISDNPG